METGIEMERARIESERCAAVPAVDTSPLPARTPGAFGCVVDVVGPIVDIQKEGIPPRARSVNSSPQIVGAWDGSIEIPRSEPSAVIVFLILL